MAAVIAALCLWWFSATDELPQQLVKAAPYAITLLVMALASQNLRMPKADGLIYRKGGRLMSARRGRLGAAAGAGRRGRGGGLLPVLGLQVGAAALVDDGRVITGCNVENASYGLGLCAECTLVGQLRLTGGGRLVALACRSGTGELLMPCGRCRQVIYEFGGPDCWWTPRPARRP